jgi:nucleolar MIF4G domain-containing protein 1
MSHHVQPKLPRELLDQLQPSSNGTGKRGGRNGPQGRKEQRKAVREQKKVQRRQPPKPKFQANRRPVQQHKDSSSSEDERVISKPLPKRQSKQVESSTEVQPKSILKTTKKKEPAPKKTRSPSPEAPKRTPRVVKEKLAEDDAEIAALEKKLGLKGKKKSKSSEEDGLDDLLDGIDEAVGLPTTKRKRDEYDEWLEKKRRKAGGKDIEPSFSDSEEDGFGSGGSDEELLLSDDGDEDDLDLEDLEDSDDGIDEGDGESADDLDDFDSEDDEEESEPEKAPRVRENPYVAPVTASTATSSKYVPPSMRLGAPSDTESTTRLRRQIQGLLNRLSEANLLTMLKEMESIYDKNARQHVTSILIDILMGLIGDRTTLSDTFMILHAGFIAAVYKVTGPHFGAQLLECLVSEFFTRYNLEKESNAGRKEASNIIALLAEMYTFQVVGSTIIFDYIRLFLTELSDLNTELLLKIIKNSGAQLRHDDPSSLKDIVILLQKSVAAVGEETLPVRTKFMIETINNLKNNRPKTGLAASSVALEHTTRMKKTLGTLSGRAGNTSEPLGVGLSDIQGSKKEGKWWLVGASWRNELNGNEKGTRDLDEADLTPESDPTPTSSTKVENETTDLLQLAKEQRMNTDIRRAIFINIMSASDYKDAHTRLTKLKLKKAQELEIPRVLIHCAGSEGVYNPYYTLIAKRLCSEHRFKWAFQYGLWDIFRRMGEKDDMREDDGPTEDDDDETDIGLRKIVNLGRMYGQLIAEDALSIKILKVSLTFLFAVAMLVYHLKFALAIMPFPHFLPQIPDPKKSKDKEKRNEHLTDSAI